MSLAAHTCRDHGLPGGREDRARNVLSVGAGNIMTTPGEGGHMSLDNDLQSLAESVATDWPEIASSGRFDAAIREIYRSHLPFPPFWTQEERDEFVSDNAGMDAAQLTTQLDDLIDIVIDRFGREHGFLPHHEDAAALIAAEHRTVACELEDRIDCLTQELAEIAKHAPGRTVASMTGQPSRSSIPCEDQTQKP